jgi:nicotinamide riboside kinase
LPVSLLRVAVLGAESTGKSSLIQSLALELTRLGHDVRTVDEYLRVWCTREGRTPRAYEQASIALEQTRQVLAASGKLSGTTSTVLLSDTTALMTAIYSDVLFGDGSLLEYGLTQQKTFDLTLIAGLDLPWVADGLQRDGANSQAPIDQRLRQVLATHGIGFHVVYGVGFQRTHSALRLLQHRLGTLPPGPEQAPWICDKCSDPGCEHRLFTGLIQPLP